MECKERQTQRQTQRDIHRKRQRHRDRKSQRETKSQSLSPQICSRGRKKIRRNTHLKMTFLLKATLWNWHWLIYILLDKTPFVKIQFNGVLETGDLRFHSYSKGIVINFCWLPNKQLLTFSSQTLGGAMSLDEIGGGSWSCQHDWFIEGIWKMVLRQKTTFKKKVSVSNLFIFL